MTDSVFPAVRGTIRITSPFLEPRRNYRHLGTDFGAQTPGVPGDQTVAAVTGLLVHQYHSDTYGNAAVIERDNGDGTYSYFLSAHLAKYADDFRLSPKTPTIEVHAGDVIGQMGNSGKSAKLEPIPVQGHFEQINTDGRLDFSHGWPLKDKGNVGVTDSGVAWEKSALPFNSRTAESRHLTAGG
jgi:murein DD-endopeptidase MepM/ murein hydrolase activator NlpD